MFLFRLYNVLRRLNLPQCTGIDFLVPIMLFFLGDNATAEVKEVAAKMPEFQEKEQEEQSRGFRR